MNKQRPWVIRERYGDLNMFFMGRFADANPFPLFTTIPEQAATYRNHREASAVSEEFDLSGCKPELFNTFV